jgi:biotin carboxyl carrier protein
MPKISAIITLVLALSLSTTPTFGAVVPSDLDSTGNEPRALSQGSPTVEIFVGCTSTKLASPIRQVEDGSQQRLIADAIMQAFNEVYPAIPLASVKYIPQPVYSIEGCMGLDPCPGLPPALAPGSTPPLGSTKIVGRWPVGINLGSYPSTVKGSWAHGDDFDALDIAVGVKLNAAGLIASNCRAVEFVKGTSSSPTAPVAPPMALKPPPAAPVTFLPNPNFLEIFVGCKSTKLASPLRQIKDARKQKLIADTIMQAFNEVYPTIPLASVKYIPQPVYNLEGCIDFQDCPGLPPALAPSATPPLGSTKIEGRWPVGMDLGSYPATAKGSWAYGDDFDALDIAVAAKLTAVGLTASNCRVVELVKGVSNVTPSPKVVEIYAKCSGTDFKLLRIQGRLASRALEKAYNSVYAATQNPIADVTFASGPNRSAATHGTATGLYETPAIKQLYAALGASFASHLVASGHRVFAGVTKCSIEVMKYGTAQP